MHITNNIHLSLSSLSFFLFYFPFFSPSISPSLPYYGFHFNLLWSDWVLDEHVSSETNPPSNHNNADFDSAFQSFQRSERVSQINEPYFLFVFKFNSTITMLQYDKNDGKNLIGLFENWYLKPTNCHRLFQVSNNWWGRTRFLTTYLPTTKNFLLYTFSFTRNFHKFLSSKFYYYFYCIYEVQILFNNHTINLIYNNQVWRNKKKHKNNHPLVLI